MSKSTPGPWAIKFSRTGYPYQVVAVNGDDQKPGAVGKAVTRWGAIGLPSSAEGLANAHLIAAAPDLLDALKQVVEWHGLRERDNDSFLPPAGQESEIARAMRAIAKAEGK